MICCALCARCAAPHHRLRAGRLSGERLALAALRERDVDIWFSWR
jgi:hypothetical protein